MTKKITKRINKLSEQKKGGAKAIDPYEIIPVPDYVVKGSNGAEIKRIKRPPMPRIEYICDELAGGRSLNAIVNDLIGVKRTTVNKWAREDPALRTIIARARVDQADCFLDSQVDLATSATMENWQLKKFQADQLKWVQAQIAPKKYGRLIVDNSITTKLPPPQKSAEDYRNGDEACRGFRESLNDLGS